AYDSLNYVWFARRFERFLYIDRVVVARSGRARGLGTRLYHDLFAFAAHASVSTITCEFDVDPPNAASERFHAKFGFREVGRQLVAEGKKLVFLQAVSITQDTPEPSMKPYAPGECMSENSIVISLAQPGEGEIVGRLVHALLCELAREGSAPLALEECKHV